jgi:hypothetical protein
MSDSQRSSRQSLFSTNLIVLTSTVTSHHIRHPTERPWKLQQPTTITVVLQQNQHLILMTMRQSLIVATLSLSIIHVSGFVDSSPAARWKKSIGTASARYNHVDGDDAQDSSQKGAPFFATSRRGLLQQFTLAAATTILPNMPAVASDTSFSSSLVVPTPAFTKDVSWPLGKVAFSLLPLAGTSSRRATVEECIIPNQMWTHDQIQGIVNVNVPVRQTVIKLSSGGLWVHNPVAPTPQLLTMMEKLQAEHGPVKHIVLGTVALEHKATFGAFCRKFPKATVWIQPGQWAFPIDLPIDALGVLQRGTLFRELPVPGRPVSNSIFQPTAKYGDPEWKDEIDYEVLGPFRFASVGGFSETAFYHKASRTLLTTDVVISVDNTPPPIIQEDSRALLFHARNSINEVVPDTLEIRQRGWRRMVQFGLVFFPSQINVVPAGEALKEARQVPRSMVNLGDGAVPLKLYPWTWNGDDDDVNNFEVISQHGKLFSPPILTKLILDREPTRTLEWVDTVCLRFPDMKRIIPCHLNNNVKASAKDFSEAFDCLRSTTDKVIPQRPLAEDLALLQKASDLLTQLHVVAPSAVCDGEPARIRGRFAAKKQ